MVVWAEERSGTINLGEGVKLLWNVQFFLEKEREGGSRGGGVLTGKRGEVVGEGSEVTKIVERSL